ncbi:MAG: 3-phosphoshikimate 1-carboxyvinyltransferase [Spirochaetaceae bacterium]|nr:MAG: 3-phosphoshikimate 1-carboxyvinyltransferase [Spirochaetaceae bacterium]
MPQTRYTWLVMSSAIIRPRSISGTVAVPASKSHTIRGIVIATLAEGRSHLLEPLDSNDAHSCIAACRLLGAAIEEVRDSSGRLRELVIDGTAGSINPPENVIDVGNSGTTLYILAGAAALTRGWSVFTGDHQIRRRPVRSLLNALVDLGAEAFTTRDEDAPPFCLRGPVRGGRTSIECPTSQYLSSLLIALPLADGPSTIDVPLLHERPYVDMTLAWLADQNVSVEREDYRRFRLAGGQAYRALQTRVAGDFSSATFFLCAAAITGCELRLEGLDMNDSQGDKAVIDILQTMGCSVAFDDGELVIAGPVRPEDGGAHLDGGEFDLNAMPDALPALAATACYAREPVRLINVPQARLKETDRIAVMAAELGRMGARVNELPDGLEIVPAESRPVLRGAAVEGHHDHRVVMALAIAGLGAAGATTVSTAESAAVTYPGFFAQLEMLQNV